MTSEEILERLKPYISDDKSNWLEKAKWHQRNNWWLKLRDYFLVYWYSFLRKMKLK